MIKRGGLKIRFSQGSAGSSPAARTSLHSSGYALRAARGSTEGGACPA